jgi:membrane-bound serine protease (ClpP class)
MKIDGSINPVTADLIHDGIEKAKKEKAECLIIHLNTPGRFTEINKRNQ